MPILKYLLHAKIVDHLAASSEPIIDNDLMFYIMQVLGHCYTSFVTSFNMLPIRLTLGEFCNMLGFMIECVKCNLIMNIVMVFRHMLSLLVIFS